MLIDQALCHIDDRNPVLNAFTVVLADQARAEADRLDRELAQARAGDGAAEPDPLFGVPIAVKEEIDVAGCVTTFGTAANLTPKDADSLIIQRLREAEQSSLARPRCRLSALIPSRNRRREE